MPFVETQQTANIVDPPKDQNPIEIINQVDDESPSFWAETIPAAFQRENSIVSGLSTELSTEERDVTDYIPDFTGYETYADSFSYVFSKAQEDTLKRNIDRENENIKTIHDSGWLGIAASFSAGILDPVNFVPIGGAATRVFKTGNMLKGALSTARVGLVASTLSETALHASQETRTWGESAVNVTAGTLLSGVLGGAIGAFKAGKSVQTVAQIEKNVNEFLTIPEAGAPDIMMGKAIPITEAELLADTSYKNLMVGEGGAVGAARVSITENKLKSVAGLEKLDFTNAVMQGITSPDLNMRKYTEILSETPYIFEKNALGVPTEIAVDTIIKSQTDVALYRLFTTTSRAFEEYSGTTFFKARAADKLGLAKERLNYNQFKVEIDKAMRNNDFSEIPEVAEAAKKLRTMVDPIYNEAVKVGLAFPVEGGPKGAPSWMRRVPDKKAINKNRNVWENRLRSWFKKKNPEMDDLEMGDLIEKTTNNFLGEPDDLPMFQLRSSGPFKGRVFDIPDYMIQDFLVQDIDVNLSGYFKRAIREIELKRAGFDEEGLVEKLEIIKAGYNEKTVRARSDITRDFAKKIKAAKTEKQVKALEKAEKKQVESVLKKATKNFVNDEYYLRGMRDRINGTFQLNAQSVLNRANYPGLTSGIKALNYVRLLGEVVLSSIPDIAMPILINGMKRTLGDSLVPFVRNLGRITKELGKKVKTSAHAQSIEELRDMGIALEMILNTRVNSFAELGVDIIGSKLSSFNAAFTKAQSFVSGISIWNDKMRLISGYSAMARILRASHAKKLSKSDTEFLARFGIDHTSLKKIGEQFKVHGRKEGGRFASGSENWTDADAYRVFQNSIRKFVDQTIIVPGQEKPFFTSTIWGSVFMQFKGFILSSYSKLFIAGLQQRDLAALNGAVTMIGLGMMSYYLKETIKGREPSDKIEDWIKEGVDRSGLLGHMFDVHQILAKAGFGLSDGPISRYRSRSGMSALVGPSFGLGEDVFATGSWMHNLFKGERPSEADIHSTRRIMPFQNVVILRKLFDMAEDGIKAAVGTKKRRQRRSLVKGSNRKLQRKRNR